MNLSAGLLFIYLIIGKVNIKGPADVGRDLWDNLTISVYQKECNASSWSQIVFTSHQDSQKSSNIQVKFLIKSNGGTCQVIFLHYIYNRLKSYQVLNLILRCT